MVIAPVIDSKQGHNDDDAVHQPADRRTCFFNGVQCRTPTIDFNILSMSRELTK